MPESQDVNFLVYSRYRKEVGITRAGEQNRANDSGEVMGAATRWQHGSAKKTKKNSNGTTSYSDS